MTGWTDKQIAMLRQMSDAGATLREIGDELNKSPDAVRSHCKRLRIRINVRTRKLTAWHPKAADSEAEIARKQRDGDRRLLRALALAFQRGDHLPRMRDAA